MRKLIRILAIVLLVLAVLVLGLTLYIGPLVKLGVTKGGPPMLGVPVSLEDSNIRLLRGHVSLKGLVIGSPEGFKAESLFHLGEVTVDMHPTSVFSDTIHIKRIYIKNPAITYEQGLKGNNISTLLANLAGDEKAPSKEEGKPATEEKPGKKVIIDEVLVEGASVKMAMAALGGKGIEMPLPTIRLQDIGKESDGASATEAVTTIVQAIMTSVTSALGSAVDLAGDGVKAAADLAGQAGSAALEGAGKVGGAAVEGVGAAGKAATEGAEAVIGGVGKAGKSLIGGVGGLLRGSKDVNEEDKQQNEK